MRCCRTNLILRNLTYNFHEPSFIVSSCIDLRPRHFYRLIRSLLNSLLLKLLGRRSRKMKSKLCLLTNFMARTSVPGLSCLHLRHHTRSAFVCNKIDIDAENWKEELRATMQIITNFVNSEEESSLIAEADPYMKRLRYEQSHWDDAIHAYRETERKQWNESNEKIISRIRERAFPKGMQQLQFIHVLDLAAEGWIKPHVDSIKVYIYKERFPGVHLL